MLKQECAAPNQSLGHPRPHIFKSSCGHPDGILADPKALGRSVQKGRHSAAATRYHWAFSFFRRVVLKQLHHFAKYEPADEAQRTWSRRRVKQQITPIDHNYPAVTSETLSWNFSKCKYVLLSRSIGSSPQNNLRIPRHRALCFKPLNHSSFLPPWL